MENSASEGNGEREDVEENSRKVKSQRLPAVSSSQDVVDTAGEVEDGSCTVKPQGLPAVSPSQDVIDTAGDVDNSSMLKPQRLPAVSPSQDFVDTAGDVDDSSMLKPQELPPVRPFEVSPFQDVVDTEGDVKDDPLKVKSQRSPTESLFEMNLSHVEIDTPTAEKRWHSERLETGCSRGTRRVYRRPTSKYPLHGGIDLSSAPFSSSKNDSDPDSSMVFSSAVSTGEDLLRPDDVTVGLTYQSSPLSTPALSKSSAGCSREDECHHSEDEAGTRTQSIAGLSASLLCWMTTRAAQTTTTTRTSLNSLDATSPPSSSVFSSRDSSGLNSHGCSEASPISCLSDSRPVSNSSTRPADFLGGLSRRLSWGWGWGWGRGRGRGRGRGKSGAFFTLSHGEVVEGGGAGGSRGSGKDTAMANNNATASGKLSVPGLTSTSCVSEAVETWGKKNANSSSSPPPPSPASRSDAMTRKATILESSTALVAPPSSPVEAATVTTVADPSVPSAHVSGVYSRTIKRRRIGVVGSGIVVRAESTDSSASETLSSIRRKKSIAADNSAPKAPKAAKEGQYPRAYHLSFC